MTLESLRICWLYPSCTASSNCCVIYDKLIGSVWSNICSIFSSLSEFFIDKSKVISGATCFNNVLDAIYKKYIVYKI